MTIDGKLFSGGVLQRFHEQIGNRYNAYMTTDGYRSGRLAADAGDLCPAPTGHRDRPGRPGDHLHRGFYTDPAKKADWEQSVLDQPRGW